MGYNREMEFYLKTESDLENIIKYLDTNEYLNSSKPVILALVGDLGSGKTTFSKYIGKYLNIKSHIVSPTFIIHREYQNDGHRYMHHLDLYRIQSANELTELKFPDLIKNNNIIVIEWADKFSDYINNLTDVKVVWLYFEHINENERKITIK